MFKMKKLAAIAAAAVMAVSAMAVNVGAESTGLPTGDSINNDMININISPYAGTSVSYTCTKDSASNVGKFIPTKRNVTFTIYPCTVGGAVIKVHTGSYTGPVVYSFVPPSQGASTPTITDTFYADEGTTYYITAEVNGSYIQASGSFYISY